MFNRNINNQLLSSTVSQIDLNTCLLPIAMKVSAQTIANNIITVNPMSSPGMNSEEFERISREIREENINNKIESLLENKEYISKDNEDHPDWSPTSGSGFLFYMDYTYKK